MISYEQFISKYGHIILSHINLPNNVTFIALPTLDKFGKTYNVKHYNKVSSLYVITRVIGDIDQSDNGKIKYHIIAEAIHDMLAYAYADRSITIPEHSLPADPCVARLLLLQGLTEIILGDYYITRNPLSKILFEGHRDLLSFTFDNTPLDALCDHDVRQLRTLIDTSTEVDCTSALGTLGLLTDQVIDSEQPLCKQ